MALSVPLCVAWLSSLATLLSVVFSWTYLAPSSVADAFTSPPLMARHRHANVVNFMSWTAGHLTSRRNGGTYGRMGERSSATGSRAAGSGQSSSPADVLSITALPETAESGVSNDKRFTELVSAREVVKRAAERLVPLFSEVDAHTQRCDYTVRTVVYLCTILCCHLRYNCRLSKR